jgi:uncharacterized protein (TIGR03435 family)
LQLIQSGRKIDGMFELYDEPARRSLFFARYEAAQMGSPVIETEHLLLGILRDRVPLIERLLGSANVSAHTITQSVQERAGPQMPLADMSVEIPFSKATKRVLEYAAEESSRLLHSHIGVEHLLLGLLRHEEGLAAEILRENGLHLASVREALVMQLSTTLPPPRAIARMLSAHHEHLLRLRVARSSRASHEGPTISSTLRSISGDGFSLRGLIAWAYRVDGAHIDLPAELDVEDLRYSVELDLIGGETWPAIDRLLQSGIERHFKIRITRETKAVDVFTMTTHDGPSPGRRTQSDDVGFAASFASFSTLDFNAVAGDEPHHGLRSIGPISMSGTTMSGFGGTLEEFLGRPVIDETGLTETYDIELQGEYTDSEALISALGDQLGLILTKGRRDMTRLVVRRADE